VISQEPLATTGRTELMSNSTGPNSTFAIQRLLALLQSGDPDASRQLLDVSMDRLRHLARRILADIPGVSRWEDTDDLLQNGAIRLWKALERHHPPTPLDYFRLAAAVIRRALIDLSRHYFGPMGYGANLARSGISPEGEPVAIAEQAGNETDNPQRLVHWTEFHEYVDHLPEDERMLFDLLWYQGLSLREASDLTGIPERTLRRRWKTARVMVYQKLLADDSED
jgi:RNA polymerase sigma-70 factor (ECF subfamily)